jgi:hypothetical protein
MTFIIRPEEHMPTFTVREPENGPPIFIGDFFEHPAYGGVLIQSIEIDYRTMPHERIVTYRAATKQDMEDHGY